MSRIITTMPSVLTKYFTFPDLPGYHELDTGSFEGGKGSVSSAGKCIKTAYSRLQSAVFCYKGVVQFSKVQRKSPPAPRLVPPYTTQHTASLIYHRLSVQGLVLHSTTKHCSVVKFGAVERNAVQWSTTHLNAVQYSELKCSAKCTTQNTSASC